MLSFCGICNLDLAERIQYRINANDWLLYIDGNTIRKFIRGVALCSSGIALCDDCGQILKIDLEKLSTASISYLGKSIIISGRSITLGDSCKLLADILILIKKDLNAGKKNTVRIAKVSEKLWFLGYNGEVLGPYTREEIQAQVDSNKFNVNALQIWTSAYTDWKMIKEVPDIVFHKNEIEQKLCREEMLIDINHCSKDEILSIPGMVETKVDIFLKKRDAGILLSNIYDLQAEFDLKPHEIELVKKIVIFRINNVNKFGRVLDI